MISLHVLQQYELSHSGKLQNGIWERRDVNACSCTINAVLLMSSMIKNGLILSCMVRNCAENVKYCKEIIVIISYMVKKIVLKLASMVKN